MRIREFGLLYVVVILFVVGPLMAQSTVPSGENSQWRVHRMLVRGGEYANAGRGFSLDTSTFSFSPGTLSVEARNGKGEVLHLQADMTPNDRFGLTCWPAFCMLKSAASKSWFSWTSAEHHKKIFSTISMVAEGGANCTGAGLSESCKQAALLMAEALNSVITFPRERLLTAEEIHRRIAAWRALATKPELSEEVRKYRLLAEDAIKENQPAVALNFYELGLESDPSWAQGWFNAALIASQIGFYDDAVEHMQYYVELMPDAADAGSARDQITVWKYKAQKK